jgi:hypothetical protein
MSMRGVLLVPDGLVYPLFKRLLDKGNLPNIQRYIYDRSLVEVKQAFSCHPSSTFENMQAINTGRFPYSPGATHYSRQTETINDLLRSNNPSKGDCAKHDTVFKYVGSPAISIHNPWNDAANDKHPALYSSASLAYLRGWNGSNAAAIGRFIESLKSTSPVFAELWFPAYDRFGHTLSDQKLRSRYIGFDKLVGRLANALITRGLMEETLFILLSDHSQSEVAKNINPNLLCHQAGFKPLIGRRREGYDARVFAYGYGVGQIYLNTSGGEAGSRPIGEAEPEERIRRLLESEAVEHIIVRRDDKLLVKSQRAEVEVEKRDGRYRMMILKGEQPFGYTTQLCARLALWHDAQTSLELTCDEAQPDAVVGIAESMSHPDSPDIRLLAAPDCDFGKMRNFAHFPAFFNANRRRSHGTLHRSQSQVPFVIAGPPIMQSRRVPVARIIDWLPTFLEMAGYQVPDGLDGRSLLH